MKIKPAIKKIVDVAMLIMMPILAAEIQLGQKSHEWIGIAMFSLFILHHVMNYKWFKNIFKGVYSPVRAFTTALNILLLFDFLALAYSGPKMSGYALSFFKLPGSMQTARILHLFASQWSLILMALHTGVHIGLHSKSIKNAIVCAISVFGAYSFIDLKMPDYLFLQTHFMFYDETKSLALFFIEIICMMIFFVAIGHLVVNLIKKLRLSDKGNKIAKTLAFIIPVIICIAVIFALNSNNGSKEAGSQPSWAAADTAQTDADSIQENKEEKMQQTYDENSGGIETSEVNVNDGLVLIQGATFTMGSPEDENWRSEDEKQHTVTVSDFYISPYELTQKEYVEIMGNNPSNFDGDNLPVENITWLDAVAFCNALSESKGLNPVYIISESSVTWDRSANGYRLPTEAEWEYACRAGTTTPFSTEKIPGADSCNFYGHYPYQIEQNYFTQNNLETKPGEYRQTTVEVTSFLPNAFGLYNVHGNVSEWVWDYYGEYDSVEQTDHAGPESGNLRVYRGGGWNDFGKNTRSAYRGTMAQNMASFNVGMRLARNAVAVDGTVSSEDTRGTASDGGKILIAFFSWGGNTRGIAHKIQEKTGADIFEIELVKPYSTNYNTVLDEAQHDQNIQARPEIKNKIENFDDYDTFMIGYPNWWASIPMPIASLLEEYDFSGKTIIPFCSHGGGRFGQSITAISKLAPDSVIGDGLSVHYSGGSTLEDDIKQWLEKNNIQAK